MNSDLLMIQQACLPPVNRLVDKRELGSLKADLGISGLTQNFSPIRGLPSASLCLLFLAIQSEVIPDWLGPVHPDLLVEGSVVNRSHSSLLAAASGFRELPRLPLY